MLPENKEASVYKKMYYLLFNAVTDALEDLVNQDNTAAWVRLVKAQREAEEAYLSAEDGELTGS